MDINNCDVSVNLATALQPVRARWKLTQNVFEHPNSNSETLTDERLPGTRVLALSPAVRPAHHHGVVLHAPQTTGLDQMDDTLPNLRRHHDLAETLHSLYLHHILNGLANRKRSGKTEL